MGLDTIFRVTLALTILGNAETRHTASSDQRDRFPTGSVMAVIRGPGNEWRLAVLKNSKFVSIPSRIQLNANTTQTDNDRGGVTIRTSGESQMSNSLPGKPNITSPDVGISNWSRHGIRTSIRGQPFGETNKELLSSDLPPVRVSDKPVPGLEINARGSFGDINIPKVIEAALNTMWGQNRQMSRDINEQYNHVHVDSIDTVMGHNIKLAPIDLKLPASRAASMSDAAARVLRRGLQTLSVSQHLDMKGTHEPNLHSRGDQEPIGPVGFLNRLARLKLSNSSRKQPPGGEKLNIADAVPLHLPGSSSSQRGGLSSQSSSLSNSLMNTTSNIERQLTIPSASVAIKSSDGVGSNNGTVLVQSTAHAGIVLIAEPYSTNVNNNGAVHPTVVKSLAGKSASTESLSSSSSSKKSRKVIQKSVTKTTIKKTVTSAKTNTAAASGVGGSSVVAAASVSTDSTGSTGSVYPAVASTSQPHLVGSIEIHKESKGITKIILKDTNNNPIVLQATGPVQIQRIVTPNGTIKFNISPTRQSPMVVREIEDDEIPSSTTAVTADREPLPDSRPITIHESHDAAQSTTTAKSDSPSLQYISFK